MIFSLIKYWTAVLFFEAGVSWPLDLDVGFIACFLLIIGESDHILLSLPSLLTYYIPVSKLICGDWRRGEKVFKYSIRDTWTFQTDIKKRVKEAALFSSLYNQCLFHLNVVYSAVVLYPITSSTLSLHCWSWPENLWFSSELATEGLRTRIGESLIVTRRERRRERGGGTEDIKCEHWADLIEKPWNGGMGTKLDQREQKSCFCFGAAYKRNGERVAGGNIF